MPEMKTLGKMPERYLGDVCVPEETKGPYFPCVYLDNKQMPEIDAEDWEVGDERTFTFTVKLKSYNLRETEEGESTSCADLELLNYATKAPKTLD